MEKTKNMHTQLAEPQANMPNANTQYIMPDNILPSDETGSLDAGLTSPDLCNKSPIQVGITASSVIPDDPTVSVSASEQDADKTLLGTTINVNIDKPVLHTTTPVNQRSAPTDSDISAMHTPQSYV